MTPTEAAARWPKTVQFAHWWLQTYCRHWATVGVDQMTTDNLGSEQKARAHRYLAGLRRVGLVKNVPTFRGRNFVLYELDELDPEAAEAGGLSG